MMSSLGLTQGNQSPLGLIACFLQSRNSQCKTYWNCRPQPNQVGVVNSQHDNMDLGYNSLLSYLASSRCIPEFHFWFPPFKLACFVPLRISPCSLSFASFGMA
uniref:Uncharacterized protein n=1 Tax=Pseudopediastrum sp. CL0201VA TaxID=2184484 RepID=A0A2U8GJR5_9CHLO|nr:hypothetical protein [Pseudopediastrum sp. CL0201VA]AWI68924.1 hypothetical protein [Pseudopediastrum sp. CL0201VA]